MHASAERFLARSERYLREAEERLCRQKALIRVLQQSGDPGLEDAERVLGNIRRSHELARDNLARARRPPIA